MEKINKEDIEKLHNQIRDKIIKYKIDSNISNEIFNLLEEADSIVDKMEAKIKQYEFENNELF